MAASSAIDALLAEHADLETQLSDPALHADAGAARRVGRRFAQLSPIVSAYRKLDAARGDLEAARELATEDESFAAEVPELEALVAELDTRLVDLLAPRDPHDADDLRTRLGGIRRRPGAPSTSTAAELAARFGGLPDPRAHPEPPLT